MSTPFDQYFQKRELTKYEKDYLNRQKKSSSSDFVLTISGRYRMEIISPGKYMRVRHYLDSQSGSFRLILPPYWSEKHYLKGGQYYTCECVLEKYPKVYKYLDGASQVWYTGCGGKEY